MRPPSRERLAVLARAAEVPSSTTEQLARWWYQHSGEPPLTGDAHSRFLNRIATWKGEEKRKNAARKAIMGYAPQAAAVAPAPVATPASTADLLHESRVHFLTSEIERVAAKRDGAAAEPQHDVAWSKQLYALRAELEEARKVERTHGDTDDPTEMLRRLRTLLRELLASGLTIADLLGDTP